MINSKQSTIEINGKRYNARTGKIIQTDTKPVSVSQVKEQPSAKVTKRAVADVSRQSSHLASRNKRTTDRSHTLMRQAVKKPVAKPAIKTSSQSTHSQPSTTSATSIKPAVRFTTKQDAERQVRAGNTQQNILIAKFNQKIGQNPSQPPAKVDRKIIHMPVKPAPIKPASQARPSITPVQRTNKVDSMLERGLREAQTHNQPNQHVKVKKVKNQRRHKIIRYGAAIASVMLLVGFYAYQNIPNISMRYATTRSGVSASLPGYRPAGFSMSNHIQYNPGQVTINFASNSDKERNFSITQKETTWNSDSLLTSYVSVKSDQIQKYEDKGRTIYLYGDNNATWVNGGVWYDINGNSQLNSDQLIRIASSL